jgi:hypothetical protein
MPWLLWSLEFIERETILLNMTRGSLYALVTLGPGVIEK